MQWRRRTQYYRSRERSRLLLLLRTAHVGFIDKQKPGNANGPRSRRCPQQPTRRRLYCLQTLYGSLNHTARCSGACGRLFVDLSDCVCCRRPYSNPQVVSIRGPVACFLLFVRPAASPRLLDVRRVLHQATPSCLHLRRLLLLA